MEDSKRGNIMMTAYALKPRRYYRAEFDGSDALYTSVWHKYRRYLNGAIDYPKCDMDVYDWLESLASEAVNDSDNDYYIYG